MGKSEVAQPPRDQRLIAAYQAALAVATEMDISSVLQRIVDLAVDVVGAKYAALGVADDTGRITQFITAGISGETRAKIGPIPQGHGLLGELIRERRPLLVEDISRHPNAVGFPPHHPPMKTLLGVPILLADRVLGNLYLTERVGGSALTSEDLAVLQVLAAHAATAIDRAHLYGQVERNRRRAEAQRDEIRVILDSLPSGVLIVTDPDGEIEQANDSALRLIYDDARGLGSLPVYDRDCRFLSAEGIPLTIADRPDLRALRGQAIRNQQLVLESLSGQRIPILVQAQPLPAAGGSAARALVVMQDITRLREAEQLKDDFLSLVSHEFRTPLTAIHGGAHLLSHQGDMLDRETQSELLADIVHESGRLDRMLANVLSLTSIMAGRLTAVAEPILVRQLVDTVVKESLDLSPRHEFVVTVSGELPIAEGDPSLLAQVLRNLFENAIKYAPAGGTIEIGATERHGRIDVSVTDQGIGIASEHVNMVFERFHRGGADPTVRGMGLGLYLSRHLVEAQGGTISAASPGVGHGATFTVTLPVARDWPDGMSETSGK